MSKELGPSEVFEGLFGQGEHLPGFVIAIPGEENVGQIESGLRGGRLICVRGGEDGERAPSMRFGVREIARLAFDGGHLAQDSGDDDRVIAEHASPHIDAAPLDGGGFGKFLLAPIDLGQQIERQVKRGGVLGMLRGVDGRRSEFVRH